MTARSRSPEDEATTDDDPAGPTVPLDEALGFAALDPQESVTSETLQARQVLSRPQRTSEPAKRPSGDGHPRPLIRPALRAAASASALRPIAGPAPLGIREETAVEVSRAGVRRATADISEHAPPGLPVVPALREDDAAPTFNHTIRGLSRAQVEDMAARGRARTSLDAGPKLAPGSEGGDSPLAEASFDQRSPEAVAPSAAFAVRADAVAPAASPPPMLAVPPPTIDPRHREIRVPRSLSEPPPKALDPTLTVMRPSPPQLLQTVSLVALLMLISAVVLPTAGGPPWELMARPAEVTMQALAAFILIAVVHLLPTREPTRAALGVVVGVVLSAFAFVAWRVATGRGAFDAQPALDDLFGGDLPNPAITGLAALVVLPAGVFSRSLGARTSASPRTTWITTAVGLALALVTFAWMSPGALFSSLADASFLGDRIAAWATLPVIAAMVVAPLGVLPGFAKHSKVLAFLLWGLALVPLVVLALFAAKSDQWLHVLEPLKLVIFVAAISLYTSAALASVLRPTR